MDAKEIKASLKEARDAIKTKDYKQALKLCKSVLQSDRENYIALVLSAVSFQETDQRPLALQAFQKATEISPDQLLAWQGLASFYEKVEPKCKELIPVYDKLLVLLDKDIEKYVETSNKLAQVALELQDFDTCLRVLKSQLDRTQNDQEKQMAAWKLIVTALSQQQELSELNSLLFLKALEQVVEDSSDYNHLENFEKYLRTLYKRKEHERLISESFRMHSMYPSSPYPLEWLCRLYMESTAENRQELLEKLNTSTEETIEKLLQISPSSHMAKLAKGVNAYGKNLFGTATGLLKEALKKGPNFIYGWKFLAQSNLHLHDYISLETSAEAGLKLIESLKQDDPRKEKLHQEFHYYMIESLCEQQDESKNKKALELCRKLLEKIPNDYKTCFLAARASFSLKNLTELKDWTSKLVEKEKDSMETLYVTCLVTKLEGRADDYLQELKKITEIFPNCPKVWLEFGKAQWDHEDYGESFISFVMCTKQDSLLSEPFYYMGRYYRLANNLDKARRCYQKAFKLNPRCEKSGAALSDLYLELENWEENLELLTYVTKSSKVGHAMWARLRLGQLYLRRGDVESSIEHLQAAVNAAPMDRHCLESLGDGYFAHEFYTSARKAFQRAKDIDPDAIYPAFKVGSIQQMLGNFQDAIVILEDLLKNHPGYVPALQYLSKSHLGLCKEYLDSYQDKRAVDHCEKAILFIAQALCLRPDLSCLWEVLGSACMALDKLCAQVTKVVQVSSCLNLEEEEALKWKEDEIIHFSLLDIFELGIKSYHNALFLCPDESPKNYIWHNIALLHSCKADHMSEENVEERKSSRRKSLGIMEKVVREAPQVEKHWSLLGIIASSKELKKNALAQHAFIRAIQVTDGKSAQTWCNLGTFYLHLDNLELGHKAFSKAQILDPGFKEAWIGQACIADGMQQQVEAMELFRHSFELGYHPYSILGYAHCICNTIMEKHEQGKEVIYGSQYHIRKMHGVTVAIDGLMWYTGRYDNNACAYSMLGLLYEHEKLFKSAADAFSKALKVLLSRESPSMQELDQVRCSYARILTTLGMYDQALDLYREVKESDFNSQCGLALARFKAGKYDEAYEAFESALDWLAPEDGDKSHVLTAMGILAYFGENVQEAKTLLLQSCELKPTSVPGLFALAAIGLLHSELPLVVAAIKSMQPYKKNAQYRTDVIFFEACNHIMKGNYRRGHAVLAKAVHEYPWDASLWQLLVFHLLQFGEFGNSSSTACAYKTSILGKGKIDVSELSSLTSLSLLQAGDDKGALYHAQKAVHMFPNSMQNWSTLFASYLSHCQEKREITWLKEAVNYMREQPEVSKEMNQWLSLQERTLRRLLQEEES